MVSGEPSHDDRQRDALLFAADVLVAAVACHI
jgi:hypothetical protein